MKTKTARRPKTPAAVQRVMRNGRRLVLLEESEYERLRRKADEWEPLLPEPDADGNYPAREYMRASIAREIVRLRRRLGLTQAELARRAGIRPETVNRIEQGKHSPSVGTVEKIDRALKEAAAEEGR
jgi:HTH-type transcriptional regulator / antitoxin HipB